MKGRPPFEGEPGGPEPPSADPLRLIQFALGAGAPIQIVNFAAAVKDIRFQRLVPPSGSCFHRRSGEIDLVISCLCGDTHPQAERCSKCGELISYHDFPGFEPLEALVTVSAPAYVGKNLQGPPEEQDAYILIQVPREAMDKLDEGPPRIIIPS